MALPTLPPLGTVDGVPSVDTANPYYLPPTGYYQGDNGQLIPNSQPNVAGSTQTTNTTSTQAQSVLDNLNPFSVGSDLPGAGLPSTVQNAIQRTILGFSIEDATVIVVGIILIAAGLFAFKSTQTVVNTIGRTAKRGAEIAST